MSSTLFSTSGLDIDVLREILKKYGIKEVTLDVAVASKEILQFVYSDGMKIPAMIYKINCFLKNHVSGHDLITDKAQLSMLQNMQKWLAPTVIADLQEKVKKFMRETSKTSETSETSKTKMYIVRPNMGFKGKGITIIDDYRYLPRAIKFAQDSTRRDTKILVSEYISDILTFNERKFHCRIYFVIGLANDKPFYDILENVGEIFTAKYKYDPYAKDRFHSDTHGETTDGDILLEELKREISEEQYRQVLDNMYEAISTACKTVAPNLINYEESANGYELLAADFLVKKDYSVILCEINDRVGFQFNSGPAFTTEMSKKIFNWIDEVVLKNLL